MVINVLKNVANNLKGDSEKLKECLIRLLEVFYFIGEQIIETNYEDLIKIAQKVGFYCYWNKNLQKNFFF